jgi:hypothetical protein
MERALNASFEAKGCVECINSLRPSDPAGLGFDNSDRRVCGDLPRHIEALMILDVP